MYKKSVNDLKKAISLDKQLMITDLWSDLKNYKEIESLLLSKGFKLNYKRPVFYKKVSVPEKSKLIFKTEKKIIKGLFFEMLKKTENADFLSWKETPAKGFREIYSPVKEWNLCAYNESNKLIGFFTLEHNKIGYGTFLLIYIKDEFRGKNYAIELLKKAEELFMKSGIRDWYESSHESNTAMIKTFIRYGFIHKRDLMFFIRN